MQRRAAGQTAPPRYCGRGGRPVRTVAPHAPAGAAPPGFPPAWPRRPGFSRGSVPCFGGRLERDCVWDKTGCRGIWVPTEVSGRPVKYHKTALLKFGRAVFLVWPAGFLRRTKVHPAALVMLQLEKRLRGGRAAGEYSRRADGRGFCTVRGRRWTDSFRKAGREGRGRRSMPPCQT